MPKKRRRYVRKAKLPEPEQLNKKPSLADTCANMPTNGIVGGGSGSPCCAGQQACAFPEPNTQSSFEETIREIDHLEGRLHGVEGEVEFLKDRIAETKLRRKQLSDALARQIRESLRQSI